MNLYPKYVTQLRIHGFGKTRPETNHKPLMQHNQGIDQSYILTGGPGELEQETEMEFLNCIFNLGFWA
jgi:hypothetical protein